MASSVGELGRSDSSAQGDLERCDDCRYMGSILEGWCHNDAFAVQTMHEGLRCRWLSSAEDTMTHHSTKHGFLVLAICGLAGACTSGKIDQNAQGSAGLGASAGAGAGAGMTGSSAGASGSTAGATGGGSAGSAAGAGGGTAGGGTPDGGQPTDGGSDAPKAGTCTAPDDTFSPITSLSLTGCMDPTDPTKFVARAIPYEVNSPLWSDGADKARAFVLPAGQKIHVDATTGRWTFPVGTVMIKNFMFDGKLVETRLFMSIDDATWIGYGYAWNAAQTDATVVGIPRDNNVSFNTGQRTVTWNYPSRQDCMDCHNAVAGNTLGPSNEQMYRVATGDTMNQFDKFEAMGLFDAPPVAPTASQVLVTPYPGQLGSPPATATLDQKARSYLQANCAHCHQPNIVTSTGQTIMSPFPNFDLRYTTALKDANICNVMTNKGLVPGSTATKILVPGQPMSSVMWVRMNEPPSEDDTSGRMPQIGTHVVDAMGLQLIGDWITAMTACPQ
jgi:uncharacterized repeat protein (TIGR03806 family)